MAPKKSIYRGPNAQHFQLVHRSQRDPLIHDPDASQHVFKPFTRENELKKGKTRADLESLLTPGEIEHHDDRGNIGEAAVYGIYYDDTDYDYMQHLRDPNEKEDGMETIMLEAPSKGKVKSEGIEFRLPAEVLPSKSELDNSQVYDAQQSIPQAVSGFQPDMDPHLRQTMEALEEEAFVDDGLEDDFFGELIKDGERDFDEQVKFEFREEGITEGDEELEEGGGRGDEDWEARFARFKKRQKEVPVEEDGSTINGTELDGRSEALDTVSKLPVLGGKRRRRGTATASSGFSMTSSAVYRNAGLTLLDERYEQFDKVYDEDDMPPDPEYLDSDEEPDEAPDLIAARDDFEAVIDDFLENYELVGRRMAPVLPGSTAAEKLDTIRRALGDVKLNPDDSDEDDDIPMPEDMDQKKERWDCETILTTYSNLENHPRLIRARESKRVPKIKLHPKSGLPIIEPLIATPNEGDAHEDDGEDEDSDDTIGRPINVTVARSRDESKEDKKARKQALKQERQARRQDKKATREQFSTERKHMVKVLAKRQPSGIKKL